MTLINQNETYKIIGACMEVHSILGSGFLEVVYKDALEIELRKRDIPFTREMKYEVNYKGILLNHNFFADFVVFGTIILEIKCLKNIYDAHIAQAINYLKVSSNRVALVINFGEERLVHKRIIL
jgi:GxxExxY protein